jgi:hypothetical protein
VKVLLSVFADTNITDDYGRSSVAMCEYGGSPELANYIQHNHLTYVSDNDENCGNITVSDQVDHRNIDTQAKLEDNAIVASVNNNQYFTGKVKNSKSSNKRKNHSNVGCCNTTRLHIAGMCCSHI